MGHFGQLSNLMLVLTLHFYFFIVVFFSLSVITEEVIYLLVIYLLLIHLLFIYLLVYYLFMVGISPLYHLQTVNLQK